MTVTEAGKSGWLFKAAVRGSASREKLSYPIACGIYSEIETDSAILRFDLNGDIRQARGKGNSWPHPHEWLKRTRGNDWLYYSTGGYTGVFEAIGEYYLPQFPYPTNSLLGGTPFTLPAVRRLIDSWPEIVALTCGQADEMPADTSALLEKIRLRTPAVHRQWAAEFARIIGGQISVLPPDARHVDYELLPLTIARGCLYKCPFCRVKNPSVFEELKDSEISAQLHRMAVLYDKELRNVNSIFLGEHDALAAQGNLLLSSAQAAFQTLDQADCYMTGRNLFLFGSVTSLLAADCFAELAMLPGLTYINIGLESADQETLDLLGKPVSAALVREAFSRMQQINRNYPNLEITANFVMADHLPEGHYRSILELIRDSLPRPQSKGSIYFSPLAFAQPSRAKMFAFHRLKRLSRLPTYLYIIQRL
jgi:hypothetical protein